MDARMTDSSTNATSPTDLSRFAGTSLFEVCQEEIELKSMLLDSMLDGVMAHTLGGQVIYANQQACDIYDLTLTDFVDLAPWGWIPEAMNPQIGDRVRSLLEHGQLVFESLGTSRTNDRDVHTEVHSRIIDTDTHGKLIISVVRDITDRVRDREKMWHLAFHDTLTGLPNRVLLDERMQSALHNADRHGDTVGVVFMDLDDFKPVNDEFGHATGDVVLRIVAERLQRCVRESDTVARIGGDEFFALFPRLAAKRDLVEVARALAECVAAPIELANHEVTVTASVGLAIYQPGEAPDELSTRADHAMYRAKRNGQQGWEEYLAEG
jgi:diguanylate cyclase (GGDEF)-like protein/PAS domain S-box-containing protein